MIKLNDFGQKIRYFRLCKNLSQSELANGICSNSYLSKVENGKMVPSSEIKELIFERLDISLETLEEQKDIKPIFLKEIKELATRINHSSTLEVEKKMRAIRNEFSSLSDPQSNLLMNLFNLRVSLLGQDKNLVEHYYEVVSKNSMYNDCVTEKYYFRFCGLYHYTYGNYKSSKNYYKCAESSLYDTEKETIYYQLALVYTQLDNISKSIYYVHKALSIYQSKLNYMDCINCNLLLAINYRRMGEHQNAITINYEILESLKNYHYDNRIKGKVLNNIGLLYMDSNDIFKAIQYFKSSLDYKSEAKDTVSTYYLLAKCYFEQGMIEESYDYLTEGKKRARLVNRNDSFIKLKVLEYKILNKTTSEEYGSYLEQVALPYFANKQEKYEVREFSYLLADFFEEKHTYKKAYSILKQLKY